MATGSAVAWFFARDLRRRDPTVPVGVICCAWGGTIAEAWMRPQAVAEIPPYAGRPHPLDEFPGTMASWCDSLSRWKTRVDDKDPGLTVGWADASHDDSGWTPGRLVPRIRNCHASPRIRTMSTASTGLRCSGMG